MMTDWLKKWMIAGIGVAALTKEKIDEYVGELVQQGQLGTAESKELARSLLRQAEEQKEELRRLIDQQVNRVMKNAGFVTQEEYSSLEERLQAVEQRLQEAQDSGGSPADER